jgi:hypothetical protein
MATQQCHGIGMTMQWHCDGTDMVLPGQCYNNTEALPSKTIT